MRTITHIICILFALTSVITACGGGGGGGSTSTPNDPGALSLWIERGKIDSGDLCHVRVDIREPNSNGVILKIRFPTSIKYSEGSAVLFAGDDGARWVTPTFSETVDTFRYLIFFLRARPGDLGGHLALELDVKGIKGDRNASIAVDLDNNDPNVPDAREFDPRRPRFSALEERGITITDDSEGATPSDDSSSGTPTPTPSATENTGG
jgi:hypothetical protein